MQEKDQQTMTDEGYQSVNRSVQNSNI